MLSIWGTAFSQVGDMSAKERNIFWDAELAYEKGDYLRTIELLKQLPNTNNSNVAYLLGSSYFNIDSYNSSITYLESGAKHNSKAYFYLAYIALNKEQFNEAVSWLEKYKAEKPNKKDFVSKLEVNQLASNIKFAQQALSDLEVVNIINLGNKVNSSEDEYVPVISTDEELLLFTARRLEDSNTLDPFGKPFENIYFSESNGSELAWSEAKKVIGDNINTETHDACVGLSPNGNTMYIYRTSKNIVNGDLYESEYINGKWSTPVIMSNNINNANSTEPSASISLDGQTLYFSSDREGGFGGYDLYRVRKLPNGEWSLPMNLGSTVNTPLNEDAPFIHPNGKDLYFSSQSFNNMGGYDIFKAEIDGDKFTAPVNLGAPTNSTKDDIYFTISGNEKHGYYSSDKPGGYGGQDIYLIDYLEKNLRQSVISGKVFIDGKPVMADITLIDVATGELSGVYVSNERNGKFIFLVNPLVEYELIVEKEGAEQHYEVINYTKNELLKKQKKVINLKQIK